MNKWLKRSLGAAVVLFIVANLIVYNHAYCFTHFSEGSSARTKKPEELSLSEKFKLLFTGVAVPKSQNEVEPNWPYKKFIVQSYKELSGWDVEVENPNGVVLLFHGYMSSKSKMLDVSDALNTKGYSTVLVDFMGHGDSEGLETTIGFKEGRDVKEVFNYAQKKYPEQQIILLGSSLGAVAIMKSIEQYDIKPNKIILQCPFGSLLETAKARFRVMGLPSSPFAQWLLLFGGWQTGFNAFEHNPINYAKKIKIPTAVFGGSLDKRVSITSLNKIYENLKGVKTLKLFEKSAHESYLNKDSEAWHQAVEEFLAD